MSAGGRIEGIYLAEKRGGETRPVDRVRAVAGRGLEGDRHFDKRARSGGEPGKDLTLIEAEAVDRLGSERGIELGYGEPRRQLVTRGISLNELVGKRFRVGEIECEGVELCHPCSHMQALTQPGVLKGLAGRGGLNADVLTDGEISVGDEVLVLD
jgi:MOSC domain-containing protein YiiM